MLQVLERALAHCLAPNLEADVAGDPLRAHVRSMIAPALGVATRLICRESDMAAVGAQSRNPSAVETDSRGWEWGTTLVIALLQLRLISVIALCPPPGVFGALVATVYSSVPFLATHVIPAPQLCVQRCPRQVS